MVDMYRATGARGPAVSELLGFGGGAFGGKSYALLILCRLLAEFWPGVQIAYFRRTYTELDGPNAAISKAYDVFAGARPADGGKEWHWDNGSAVYFRHCQFDKDKHIYQSQRFDVLLIDEATSFEWPIVDYLIGRNAKTIDHAGFRPFTVLVTNPGNVGHAWYASMFDLIHEKEVAKGLHERVKKTRNPNGIMAEVYFIPALLEDNEIGVALDPEYERRLMERDPTTARALRFGDWTVFEGQAFPLWIKSRVSVPPFEIPAFWPKWRASDYGLGHPFAAGWATMDLDTTRVYVYRAVSIKGLTDLKQAQLVKQMSPPDELIIATYAGHDMWTPRDRGTKISSSADVFKDEGVPLTKADVDRINGVRKIDRLLADLGDGMPAIQVFEPYYNVFSCMTSLVRDPKRPDDVLKVDGDDPFDMLKYLLTNLTPKARRPVGPGGSSSTNNPMNRYRKVL